MAAVRPAGPDPMMMTSRTSSVTTLPSRVSGLADLDLVEDQAGEEQHRTHDGVGRPHVGLAEDLVGEVDVEQPDGPDDEDHQGDRAQGDGEGGVDGPASR